MSTDTSVTPLAASDRTRLGRRAQLLAVVSVGYNLVEATVGITGGSRISPLGRFRA
jgi:hypothetical protein